MGGVYWLWVEFIYHITHLPMPNLSADQSNCSPGFLNFQLTNTTTWLWRWLPHRLSKRQSLTTVLLRTPITQKIFFNQGMLLLSSNHFLIYWLSSLLQEVSSQNQTSNWFDLFNLICSLLPNKQRTWARLKYFWDLCYFFCPDGTTKTTIHYTFKL